MLMPFINIIVFIIEILNFNLINCETFKDDNVSNFNYLNYDTNPLTLSLLPTAAAVATEASESESKTADKAQSLPIFEINTNNNKNNFRNHFYNNKPSKLRLYLLADLAKAASGDTVRASSSTGNNKLGGTYIITSSSSSFLPLSSCNSEVNLKITTRNCSCINFNCEPQRFNNNNNNKTSRKLRILERNCEDHCCDKIDNDGKSNLHNNLKTKFLNVKNHQKSSNLIKRRILNCGKILSRNNDNYTVSYDKIQIPWIIYVLNLEDEKHQSQQQCIGTILRQNVIAITSNCSKRYTKSIQFKLIEDYKKRETDIKEIVRNDYLQNTVFLILSNYLDGFNEENYPCISNDQILFHKENDQICYATLLNATGIEVKLKNKKECIQKAGLKLPLNDDYKYICAEFINGYQQRHTILPGSPLVCAVLTTSSYVTDSSHHNHHLHQNNANLNGFQTIGIFNSIIEDNLIFDNVIDQLQNIK